MKIILNHVSVLLQPTTEGLSKSFTLQLKSWRLEYFMWRFPERFFVQSFVKTTTFFKIYTFSKAKKKKIIIYYNMM